MIKTQDIDFEIIFITAHQRYDYATKAIDFSCLAFLSKPIDPEILRGAIEKAKEKQTQKIQIDQLLAKLQALDERHAHIIIPTANNNKVAVPIADITHFEADEQMTKVYLQDGLNKVAFRRLGHFKKILMDEYDFFLIHNSILINIEQVKSFKSKDLTITFKNNTCVTASRRYGSDFGVYWNTFNRNKSGILVRLKQLLS